MPKHLDDLQAGKEIVITRHGKPAGALVSVTQLYRYREQDGVMGELLSLLKPAVTRAYVVLLPSVTSRCQTLDHSHSIINNSCIILIY